MAALAAFHNLRDIALSGSDLHVGAFDAHLGSWSLPSSFCGVNPITYCRCSSVAIRVNVEFISSVSFSS